MASSLAAAHAMRHPHLDALNELAPHGAIRRLRRSKPAALTRGASSSPLQGEGRTRQLPAMKYWIRSLKWRWRRLSGGRTGGGPSRMTGTMSGPPEGSLDWRARAYSASLITHSERLAALDQNSRNRSH